MFPIEPEISPDERPEEMPPIPTEMPDNPVLEGIKEIGSAQMGSMQRDPIQCITIIGQIEGHLLLPPHNKTTKYEHIIPLLVDMEQDENVKGLLFLLNTVGGDVEAGLAIAEMISGLSKPTVSLVLGGGHSIGVPLAVSTRHSFIARTATMTVHPIRMNGLIIGVAQTYEYFNRMQERIVSFVAQHSIISESEFRRLMLKTGDLANDIGTILVGQDAVQCGLIHEVGDVKDALRKLQALIQESEQKKS